MADIDCQKVLGYWTIGIQYLHMVQVVANEIAKQENPHVVISDKAISETDYAEATKWSDHALIIPLLFDFYHGLEVVLKGFLAAHNSSVKPSHKLTKLLDKYNAKYPDTYLGNLIGKYIEKNKLPEIIKDFLAESNSTIDDYYQALKYAEDTNGLKFHHYFLKYKGKRGVVFFNELHDDIDKIRKEVVKLGRELCP